MKDSHKLLQQKHEIQLIVNLDITNSEFVLNKFCSLRLCFDVYQKLARVHGVARDEKLPKQIFEIA
jgi:hypothetical protein